MWVKYLGWQALGDIYCNVERRRSGTLFELMQQWALGVQSRSILATRPNRPSPNPLEASPTGCTADLPRRALTLLGSNFTPVHLVPVPSGVKFRDWAPGVLRGAQGTPCWQGTPRQPSNQSGLVTQMTAPPAEPAATKTTRRPDHCRHLAGPGRWTSQ